MTTPGTWPAQSLDTARVGEACGDPPDVGAAGRDLLRSLRATSPVTAVGRVVHAVGTTLRATGLRARIGQTCRVFDPVHGPDGDPSMLLAEIIGFAGTEAILAPLGPLQGLCVGAAVEVQAEAASVPCGQGLLGRVLDAWGEPMDGLGPLKTTARVPLYRAAPSPLTRHPVEQALETGVRAIDGLLTVGQGQRLGIFAMAGGGKSTLLGMLARRARSEVNVIALIGERGREVREFITDSLGPEGLARSVVVVSTSDRPPLERVRAAYAATAMAEGFRDHGARVLLMMDSVTRFARGLREVGLSAQEPPVRRGFPPSVFAELPRLFERAGNDEHGSITAFYTVLAEDEDGSDPVAEEVRSILDGHIVLSRALAQAAHYPSIDVLASTSRVFARVATPDHQAAAQRLRSLLARHAEVEFLLRVGEYQAGSDPLADLAIERMPMTKDWLTQRPDEPAPMDRTLAALQGLVA